jgi:hypothetical protein
VLIKNKICVKFQLIFVSKIKKRQEDQQNIVVYKLPPQDIDFISLAKQLCSTFIPGITSTMETR